MNVCPSGFSPRSKAQAWRIAPLAIAVKLLLTSEKSISRCAPANEKWDVATVTTIYSSKIERMASANISYCSIIVPVRGSISPMPYLALFRRCNYCNTS